jgi:hypothetical protein
MKRCEYFEMLISALMDGEVDQQELIAALDHMVGCPSCQDFYRGARELQDIVDQLPVPAAQAAPGKARPWWAALVRWPAIPQWAYGAAAVLVLTAALWTGGVLRGDGEQPPAIPADQPLTVILGESPDQMDDNRFLALTVELLQADPRYHIKLYEILGQLQDSPLGGDENASFAQRGGEGGDTTDRDTREHGGEALMADASEAWAE